MTINPVPGDVISCMQELGVDDIKVAGNEVAGRCPMHKVRIGKEDHHSSWSVNSEGGYFNCFSCGYKGPFVLLVKDMLGVSWEEAHAWVLGHGGITRVKAILEGAKRPAVRAVDTTTQVNEASLALFVPPPAEALSERHITARAAEEFGVLWDTENSNWILPIRDDNGRLLGWQSKRRGYVKNYPKHIRMAGTLFGYHKATGSIGYLFESPLDAMRLWGLGFRGAVAACGSHVSETQVGLLLSHFDRLVVALDNDAAGWKESRRIKKNWAHRISMKFLSYDHTKAKDIGEMTDAEIATALANSYSSVFANF